MQKVEVSLLRVLAILATAFAVASLAAAPLARAQDLTDERAKVLTAIGHVQQLDVDLFPISEGLGLVFKHVVNEPTAVSLRAHFVVERAGESWGVRVRGESGDSAWSTWDAVETEDEFWSDVVAGETMTIEVFSSRPANPLQLRLDKIAVGTAKTVPVSITGPNDLRPIGGQADWIVDLGRSVARLRFESDDGKTYVCTAFLVASDIMLTNEHCIATEAEMRSTLVDFDYDTEGPPGWTARLSALIDHDFVLDYSLIRLAQAVDRKPLPLRTARPADGEQLLIIQHPAGEPKQVSLKDCLVDGPLVTGRGGGTTDFGHQCDTKGGSSGSPVIRFADRSVVGLHHLGFSSGSGNLFNRASHMGLVLEAMDPAVRGEIEGDR